MYNINIYKYHKKLKHKAIARELQSREVLDNFTHRDYEKYLNFRKEIINLTLQGGENQLINEYLKFINTPNRCSRNIKIKLDDSGKYSENTDSNDQLKVYTENSNAIKKVLKNETYVNFLYYRGFDGVRKLCPICGAEIRVNYIEHYYPKAKFNLFSDRIYNLHICCNFCNSSGKDIDFHPYFMIPNIVIKHVKFSYSDAGVKFEELHLEEEKRLFILRIENEQLKLEIKGKMNILSMSRDNDDIKGIYVGYLHSIQELEGELYKLYVISLLAPPNLKRTMETYLSAYAEKSFNGNKKYWKYQLMENFCEHLLNE